MKNKHISFWSAAVLGAMLCTSCGDFLSENPKAIRTSASYYGDGTTLESGLMGIYLSFQDLYRDETPYVGVLGTDEAIPQFYMPDFNTVFRYQLDANNSKFVSKWYQKHYEMIARANVVIARGNAISGPDDQVRAIVAEAKMLRGWAYFRLAQIYGPVPLVIDETTPPIDYSLARAPLKDVYAQIVKDMGEATAEGLLPMEKSASQPGRLYYYSALGLYGKVLLAMASHKENHKVDDALAAIGREAWGYRPIPETVDELYARAEEVLSKVVGKIELAPEYSHLFCQKYKNTLPENMWEIQFASGRPTGNWFLKRYGATTYPFIQARDQRTNGCSVNQIMYTTRLFFTYGEGDARRDWNLSTTAFDYSINDPDTGVPPGLLKINVQEAKTADAPQSWLGCTKFRWDPDLPLTASNGESDYEYMSCNFPLLRYADVVLMYVEANLKGNGGFPDAGATNLFNSLRVRARGFDEDGNPVTAAQTPEFPNLSSSLINADTVLNERMRELCFESVRWFDLARTGQLDVRYNKNIDDGMMPPNYTPTKIDAHDYLWPMPQQQVDRSTNKEGFFQNPEY